MKVKLKKNCTVAEHGLMGSAGDMIHVNKKEAEHLVLKGLADHTDHVKPKEASKQLVNLFNYKIKKESYGNYKWN